jgi:hypothetical protein
MGADDAALAIAARHALHDEELVVALASGSLEDEADVERAKALADRCALCRELRRDIGTIGEALRAEAQGTVTAPRDFRLTLEDARRLGGPVRAGGFLAAFRRSFARAAGPVGASMAALGMVGLLVGSVGLGGGAASAPLGPGYGAAGSTNGQVENKTGAEPGPTDLSIAMGPVPTSADAGDGDVAPRNRTEAATSNPIVLLLGGSVLLLVGGFALLFVAFRRGREGESRR